MMQYMHSDCNHTVNGHSDLLEGLITWPAMYIHSPRSRGRGQVTRSRMPAEGRINFKFGETSVTLSTLVGQIKWK